MFKTALKPRRLRQHWALLLRQIDPILDDEERDEKEPNQKHLDQNISQNNNNHSSPKGHYAFAVSYTVASVLYGTVVHQLAGIDNVWNLENLREAFSLQAFQTSPHLYTHQAGPRVIWNVLNGGILLDTLAALAILLVLYFSSGKHHEMAQNHRLLHSQFSGLVHFGPEILSQELSTVVVTHRKVLNKVWKTFLVLINLSPYVYEVHYWLLVKDKTWVSSVFWLFIYPLYFAYVIYGIFESVFWTLLSSHYLCLRHRALVEKLQELSQLLEALKCLEKLKDNLNQDRKLKQRQTLALWLRHLAVNRSLVRSCSAIQFYCSQARPLLSIILPFTVFIQCLMGAMALFEPRLTAIYRHLFALVALGLNLLLFGLVHQCAAVVKLNKQAEGRMRRLHFGFFVKSNFGNSGVPFLKFSRKRKRRLVAVRALLMIGNQESLAKRYAFRLVNGQRITENTYYLIISYMALVFMFLFKNRYHW